MTIEGHHFGLTARPFQLTPNPDFWFESATHRKAMAYLSYGLTLGEGVIVITGEIGAGKTTLLGHLLQTLDRARVEPVELCPGDLARTDPVTLLTRALCAPDLAETTDGDPSALVRTQIAAYARMGKRLLLIIDEAQNLSAAALDQLRLISDAGPAGQPVVQLLLLGQPEFRDTLDTPALEQLRQRIIAANHLTAMLPGEVKAYIEHRLTHAGWQGRPAITDGAAQAIADLTQGLPRKINQVMTRVLMLASLSRPVRGRAMRIVNPLHPRYRIYTRLWRHMPLPLANFFGPMISRGLG